MSFDSSALSRLSIKSWDRANGRLVLDVQTIAVACQRVGCQSTFSYQSKTYSGCTMDGNGGTVETFWWCSTVADFVDGSSDWEYCDCDMTVDDTLATTAFDFNFQLLNPSKSQDSPGVGIELEYFESDWTNDATSDGTLEVIGSTTDPADYPMYIAKATVSSEIAQSSPYPCDSNTLIITITVSINIYPICSPILSLTGLTGSTTADTALPVSFSGVSGISAKNAEWDRAGDLTVSMFTDEANTVIVPKNVGLVFSFVLSNPPDPQASVSTQLALTLQDKPTGEAGYSAPFHDAETHTDSSPGMPGAQTSSVIVAGKDQCTASPEAGDADPLYVKSVSATTFSVTQNSANPCANNVITITLEVDGPVFPNCVPAITISGLVGAVTASAALDISVVPSTNPPFDAQGTWTNSGETAAPWSNTGASGVLILGVSGTMIGCESYSISFNLTNPSVAQVIKLKVYLCVWVGVCA